jgi:hypothetical protein
MTYCKETWPSMGFTERFYLIKKEKGEKSITFKMYILNNIFLILQYNTYIKYM